MRRTPLLLLSTLLLLATLVFAWPERCAGTDLPLLQLDDLRVEDGACADPRLEGIDLRGRVRVVAVSARDGDGREVRDGAAFVLTRANDANWAARGLGRGVARLATPGPLDVLVCAPGHEIALLPAVAQEATATLRRAAIVRCRVAASDPAVPAAAGVTMRTRWPPDSTLTLHCEPIELGPQFAGLDRARVTLDSWEVRTLASVLGESARVDADGTATLHVRLPGRYRLHARLDDLWEVPIVSATTIDLPAAGDAITVTLDAAALRALTARIVR